MSVKIPAIAASILLAGTIGAQASHAQAASVRVAPAIDNGYSMQTHTTVGLGARDACAYRIQTMLLGAYPGAPALPIDKTAVRTFNGCGPLSTYWEDGSISDFLSQPVSTTRLVTGKHYYAAIIWTRAVGTTRWVRHATVRSFWHTAAADMPTARIAF